MNNAGIPLIKQFEGCKLKAYRCPAGVWTQGWGTTGCRVKPGTTITQEVADQWLYEDVAVFEAGVLDAVDVPLTANQLGALTSFADNVGLSAFRSSTLLRLLNAGDYAGAAGQFPRWNRAGGKVLNGLIRRRAAEQALFVAPEVADGH